MHGVSRGQPMRALNKLELDPDEDGELLTLSGQRGTCRRWLTCGASRGTARTATALQRPGDSSTWLSGHK